MIEHKLIRIEYPGDPEQCQSGGKQGQCPYKKMPGYEYCQRHGGPGALKQDEREAVRTYRLHAYQNRVNELADDGKIKSLREEIGITRMLLEAVINSCESESQLIIQCHKISDLVMKLEKLVSTCNNLEMKMGILLDRNAIIQIGSIIVGIVSDFITDPQQREDVSKQILEAVATTVITKDK